jgi:hypothetical protein
MRIQTLDGQCAKANVPRRHYHERRNEASIARVFIPMTGSAGSALRRIPCARAIPNWLVIATAGRLSHPKCADELTLRYCRRRGHNLAAKPLFKSLGAFQSFETPPAEFFRSSLMRLGTPLLDFRIAVPGVNGIQLKAKTGFRHCDLNQKRPAPRADANRRFSLS